MALYAFKNSWISVVGGVLMAAGAVSLVVGLLLVDSLTGEFRKTLDVSRSALSTIGDTVTLAEEISAGTGEMAATASSAASSAALASTQAATTLGGVADFLDQSLPNDIESISRALPGVIDAADAIDGTLRALSLFGVDYSPDEPFGESLRRIESALDGLPAEITAQSGTIRALIPTADTMADDIDLLSVQLLALSDRLTDVGELADSYSDTVGEASVVFDETDGSLDRTVLLLRVLVVLGSLSALAVGIALIGIDRNVTVVVSDDAESGL